jgi:hypothetical protein
MLRLNKLVEVLLHLPEGSIPLLVHIIAIGSELAPLEVNCTVKVTEYFFEFVWLLAAHEPDKNVD